MVKEVPHIRRNVSGEFYFPPFYSDSLFAYWSVLVLVAYFLSKIFEMRSFLSSHKKNSYSYEY